MKYLLLGIISLFVSCSILKPRPVITDELMMLMKHQCNEMCGGVGKLNILSNGDASCVCYVI